MKGATALRLQLLHPAVELNISRYECKKKRVSGFCTPYLLPGAGEQLLVYGFPSHLGVTGCAQHGTGFLFVLYVK